MECRVAYAYAEMIVIIPLLLAGCTPSPSGQQAVADLNCRYAGRNVNAFIEDYGRPFHLQKLDHGTLYLWVSIAPSAWYPNSLFLFPSPRGAVGFGDPETSNEPQYCEIRIQADSKGIARQLSLVHDSAGEYSNSRCAEIFGTSAACH